MTRFTFLGVASFLSAAIATPALAQAVIQEPGAYAFHYPNGDLGIASTLSQRREAVVVGGGVAGARASAPPFHSSGAGRETATRPWSGAGRPPPAACSRRSRIRPLHLNRSLIRKTRTSTARSATFAEAAERPNSQLYDHRKVLPFRNSIESGCPWDFRPPLRNRSYAPSTKREKSE